LLTKSHNIRPLIFLRKGRPEFIGKTSGMKNVGAPFVQVDDNPASGNFSAPAPDPPER
jgi:hypothetical protein